MLLQDIQQLVLTQFCVDNAAEPVFLIRKDGRFIYANDASLSHLQYEREEMLAMTIHEIDPNFPEKTWQESWRGFSEKKTDLFESIHLTKSGDRIPVEVKISHILLDGVEYQLAFVRNITERKKIEQAMIDNLISLRKTIDAATDGAWDKNLQTGEVEYGKSWASSLGYSEEDLISGGITWDDLLHPEDREETLRKLREHLGGGSEKYEAEFRLKNKDDTYRWMYARGKVIEHDANGNPVRFVGTHSDITGRKLLEEDLLKRSEDIKMFAYSVAHDLKNPATAIQGLAERFLARSDELSEDKKRLYCQQISASAKDLVLLVERINNFISTQQSAPLFEKIFLKELVRSCRREFYAQLHYRGISWCVFAENPQVRVDKLALARVLRNLVENSLKYGGSQLSEITIGYEDTPEFHVVSVSDNGEGIAEAESKKIFEPFERKNRYPQQTGAGLGLAIVREIAIQHKGEVWIEPKPKGGVKFCFAFSKEL